MLGSVPYVVYGAMLAATVAGQFLGMAVDALALGRHLLWVPLAFSVLLEALVGARYGASRIGRPLTAGERARVTTVYTAGLIALSVPLAGWIAASKATRAELVADGNPSLGTVAMVCAVVLGVGAACTAARFVLMTLFSSKGTS